MIKLLPDNAAVWVPNPSIKQNRAHRGKKNYSLAGAYLQGCRVYLDVGLNRELDSMNDFEPLTDGQFHTAQKRSDEFDRSLLRAIQEASPDGILVVDERGAIVSYNRRFIETWQIPASCIHAHSGEDGSIPEDRLMHAALEQLKYPEAFIQRVQELYANPPRARLLRA